MFREVPFVGREDELRVLRAALTSAASGRGRVVLLVGEPGIGKSRTAEELGNMARASGAEVLVGRCYEGEGAPAFWPWLQLLEAYVTGRDPRTLAAELGTAAADVAAVCPPVRAQLPELPPAPGGDPEHARFRFFDGVTRALGRAAVARPVVIVVDDLHGADRPSLLLLRFLARALSGARILVVGALRDVALTAEHPLAEALGELVRERASEWLRLGGLDEGAVAAVIQSVAGMPAPAGLAAAVHARTDGNPLYVTEVVRALVAAGPLHPVPPGEAGRLPVPDTVRATIAGRLGQRSVACRELLTRAALFGREFQMEALTRASGQDAVAVLAAVDEAEEARLVTGIPEARRRYRFAHALVGETLVDALGPARRSALHREAAAALAADPRASELATEIAHHYHAAGPAGDPAAAVTWAARAGERTLGLLAYEEAARLYRLALDALGWTPPDGAREAELLLALGDACKRAGDVEAAKATFLRAAELGRRLNAPEILTRAALGFAPAVTYAEQPAPDAAVTSLLEEAIAAWDERDNGLHASALARLALALFFGDPVQRQALIERAVAMARRLGDPSALRHVLASRLSLYEESTVDEGLAMSTELATLAEAAADGEALAFARVCRCVAFVEGGDVPSLDAELAALGCLSETLKAPVWAWWTALVRVMRAMIAGQFVTAEREIHEARTVGEAAGLRYAAPAYFVGQMLWLRLLQGSTADLELAAADYRTMFQSHPDPNVLTALVLAEIELGHEAEARRLLERFTGGIFQVGTSKVWLVDVTFLSAACAALGDAERGASLYEMLRTRPLQCVVWGESVPLGPTAHFLGLLARAMGNLDAAAAHFEDALAMSARMGARPFLARTQLEYATLLEQRSGPGDAARAGTLAAEAAATAETLGMVGLRAHAAAMGGAPAASHPGLVAVLPGSAVNVFRREGEYWTIAYSGGAIRLRDSKGLHYVAQLLAHPAREIHVADLAILSVGPHVGARRQDGLAVEGDLGAVLDPHAIADYKRRLTDLRDELEQATAAADAGHAARARHEIEAITRELSAAYGLGGRVRRAGDPTERLRKAVTNQIRRAVDRIRTDHPALGRHLANSLRTGFLCVYLPEEPLEWLF